MNLSPLEPRGRAWPLPKVAPSALALAALLGLGACHVPPAPVAKARRPASAAPLVARAGLPAPTAPTSARPETGTPETSPPEDPADEGDLPDEPSEGDGVLRIVGAAQANGPCRLRVAPADPTLPPAVLAWIRASEARAAHTAAELCRSGRALGSVAASFACSTRRRRPNLLIVACCTFPNVMGNSTPYPSHAIFDTKGAQPERLTPRAMISDRTALCRVAGEVLAARGPQLHTLSPAEWAAKCRADAGLAADETISVRGGALTFDTPYEFWAWGNAPDPLTLPVESLRGALTPRFEALLAR